MIFDEFDMIRIVSLVTRNDRRRDMLAEMRRAGLADDPRVLFFDAIRPADAGSHSSIGAHGCFLSHQAILSEAAAKDMSVLILEDDCVFTSAIADYRATAGWDIFYGGYIAAQPDRLQESDIIGSHMMGFSASAARQISDYFASLRYEGQHPPIDAGYVWFRRAHPEVKTVFADPPIGNQRASRSDVAAQVKSFDRLPIIRDAVELMRRVRNRFRKRDVQYTGELKW